MTTTLSCSRRATLLGLALLMSGSGVAAATGAGAATPDRSALVPVLVTGSPGSASFVLTSLSALGATGVRPLAVIDGASARVPASALARLRSAPGVQLVTRDRVALPNGDKWGDDSTGESGKGARLDGTWKADKDLGSTLSTAKQIGADELWHDKITGQGVGVALLDTGVTPVKGLDGPGKVVFGPDLSVDSQDPGTRYLDEFGHGTHMAGIIAGRDPEVKQGKEDDRHRFVGIAPDATLVSVKVGAADGGVDVSQVIAGIDWVVEHRDVSNIRVLNLSYGTDSVQSPTVDPLAHAVENAWRAGIVVVVSAGNGGQEGATSLAMPAIDPYVIAVGSSDHNGSDKVDQASVGAWTNPGTDARRPDVLAPGKSVVSLRVPGSFADLSSPLGRVTTEPTGRFFRGTGTSQSAAVVSGLAALLLQRDPTLTPDQVKGLLEQGADALKQANPTQGAGLVDVKAADKLVREKKGVKDYRQSFPSSTGLGSLQASRGGSGIVDPISGAPLLGEQDVFGQAWDGPAWASASSAGTSWSGGSWRGRAWAGSGWTDDDWAGRLWAGRLWAGTSWSGDSWDGRLWAGRLWAGGTWDGRTWAGRTWANGSWAGADWAGRLWAGRLWAGRLWAGRLWAGF